MFEGIVLIQNFHGTKLNIAQEKNLFSIKALQ